MSKMSEFYIGIVEMVEQGASYESIEQMMLVEVIGRPASRAVNSEAAIAQAATSFARYFTLLRVDPSPEDDRDLARILSVAFPGSRHGNEAGGG